MPVAGRAQSSQLTDQRVRERADALLRQMTVEEKAGQLNQASGVTVADAMKVVSDEAIEKGQVGSILWQVDVKEINGCSTWPWTGLGCTFPCWWALT